jgi:hypothetical protein
MLSKLHSAPVEIPPAPEQQAPPTPKRFGKKLTVTLVAIAAIVIIAVALLIPQGAAIIPLEVNYKVGEEMVYDVNVTATSNLGDSTLNSTPSGVLSNLSLNATVTIQIVSFDGDFYTLNNTQTMTYGNKTLDYSFLQRMNKTGYSTLTTFSLGSQQVTTSNTSMGMPNPYITELLNRKEVKVGDKWEVPFPYSSTISQYVNITGGITMTFQGFEDLTVPTGTYRVFRVDMTSHDLIMHLNAPANATINLQSIANMNINSQMYVEYGTLRQIKSTIQESITYQSTIMNYTMGLSMDMTLKQHTIPPT